MQTQNIDKMNFVCDSQYIKDDEFFRRFTGSKSSHNLRQNTLRLPHHNKLKYDYTNLLINFIETMINKSQPLLNYFNQLAIRRSK